MKLPSLALENGIPSVSQLKLVKEMNLVCNLYETEDTILLGTSENIFFENYFRFPGFRASWSDASKTKK